MSMAMLLFAFAVMIVSGLISWGMRDSRHAASIGVWGCVAGCVLGFIPALYALTGAQPAGFRLPWAVPGGSFSVGLDPLSALFLLPILGLAALGACYGLGYMASRERVSTHWLFYNLLTAAMVMVTVARNGVLFLIAWEAMALASYFLVTTDNDKEDVREAGWTYLVATHLGTAFLFGFFAIMGRASGSLDFDRFQIPGPGLAGAAFLLALIGFGSKAGIVPLHVWLPEAHPAAPSHVSALMSGVMIKTGIYGLVRALTFLGPPAPWQGWALLGIGVISGVGGVLFALAQHDLKRLLAYSSVENIGIIFTGLGVGLLGLSVGSVPVSVLGFAGGLLHVINHGVFKGLLFLGAGGVLHTAGTGTMDQLGGLLKRMPRTGLLFLIGAAAIAGLPPLNGFVSEFLVFFGCFQGMATPLAHLAIPLGAGLAGLALISGLAAACFCKVYGSIFLGEPRRIHADKAHDPGLLMLAPQAMLAMACLLGGLFAPFVFRVLSPAVGVVTGFSTDAVTASMAPASTGLRGVSLVFSILIALIAFLALIRRWLLSGRSIGAAGTWDCGYAAPVARIQYTASSFTQPLTLVFHPILRSISLRTPVIGIFPAVSHLTTLTADICRVRLYEPAFIIIASVLEKFRRLQQGNMQVYVLYIAVTLMALLVWELG